MRIYAIILTIFCIFSNPGSSYPSIEEKQRILREKTNTLNQLQSEYTTLRAQEREQQYVISYFVPYINAAVRIKELVDEDIKGIEKSLGALSSIPNIEAMKGIDPDQMSNFYIETVLEYNNLELACSSARKNAAFTFPRLSRLEDINKKYKQEKELIDKHMPNVRSSMTELVKYAQSHMHFLIEQSKRCKILEDTIQNAREKMFTYWIQSIAQSNANAVIEFENMLKTNDMIKLIWDIYINAFLDVFDLIRRKNFYRAQKELSKVKFMKETLRKIIQPYLISESVRAALDNIDSDFKVSFEEKQREIEAVPRNDWLPQRFNRLQKEYEFVKKHYGENHSAVQRMKKNIDTARKGQASYMNIVHIYSLLDYAEQEYLQLYEKAR